MPRLRNSWHANLTASQQPRNHQPESFTRRPYQPFVHTVAPSAPSTRDVSQTGQCAGTLPQPCSHWCEPALPPPPHEEPRIALQPSPERRFGNHAQWRRPSNAAAPRQAPCSTAVCPPFGRETHSPPCACSPGCEQSRRLVPIPQPGAPVLPSCERLEPSTLLRSHQAHSSVRPELRRCEPL